MDSLPIFRPLAISLLLGLLVGLQRERTEPEMAGFRTFPLITTLGTLCALLAQQFGYEWILAAGFAGIIAVIVMGNLAKLRRESPGTGVTTEFAILVMFAVGAFVVVGPWEVAVVVAFGVAILLHLKPQMHGFAARMGEEDFRAILQFVLITFIILPVLPDKDYDPLALLHRAVPALIASQHVPFDVLNPYEIWLLVVLVVSISLGGYVMYKLFGSRAGTVLGGILGGTISSTATTVSYSRRSATTAEAVDLSAVVIMIASTITYIRVLIEVAVAAPSFLTHAAGPILVLLGVSTLLAAGSWMTRQPGAIEMPEQANPTELKSAIVFAVMYAVVLMAVAAGERYLKGEFKDQGLYAIAGLSGMTDMDAITLSTSRLVQAGRLEPQMAWRLLVIGTMSNVVFKGILIAVIGHRRLLKRIVGLFAVALLAGAAVLLLWPT